MDVWCAIRTYPKHAEELGNPIPQEPVFFLKPTSSIDRFGKIDSCEGDVHHEIELVVKLGPGLIPQKMTLGLDLTKRSIQDKLKQKLLDNFESFYINKDSELLDSHNLKIGNKVLKEIGQLKSGTYGHLTIYEDNIVMNGDKPEHIKEAAQVISQYCDIVGVRSFASLENKKSDLEDSIVNAFVK